MDRLTLVDGSTVLVNLSLLNLGAWYSARAFRLLCGSVERLASPIWNFTKSPRCGAMWSAQVARTGPRPSVRHIAHNCSASSWIVRVLCPPARAYHMAIVAQCAPTSSAPAERLDGVSDASRPANILRMLRTDESGSRLLRTMFSMAPLCSVPCKDRYKMEPGVMLKRCLATCRAPRDLHRGRVAFVPGTFSRSQA
jgi:hypothetical protein